jgi:hypothetical protein
MKRETGITLRTILVLLLIVIVHLTYGNKYYYTIKSGNWEADSVWKNGEVPSYTGELPNRTYIKINHDVHLVEQSFTSGNQSNRLEIHIGEAGPAKLFVDHDFLIKKGVDITIYENSALQVGTVPEYELFDFCDTTYTGNYRRSLFDVDGSNNDPTLRIKGHASFLVYGDFKVNNKFTITVDEHGSFEVKGNFDAGNSADVSFSGAGGSVGCTMSFDNQAIIHLNVGVLNVGGDLLFGNTGDIHMSASTIDVKGGLCSFHGQGSGAVIKLHGDTLNEPSEISVGYICSDVDMDTVPGIIIRDISLPIKLMTFTAEITELQVIIHWITATEINNNFFTLERSRDLNSWEIIGYITGAGTTSQISTYRFIDTDPLEGLSYYRLKQTDFDGAFEYFDPVAVTFSSGFEEPDFIVLKNGSSWTIHVEGEGDFIVDVYAMNGHRIASGTGMNMLNFASPGQAVIVRVTNTGRSVARSKVIM